jgi:hypothetical protein
VCERESIFGMKKCLSVERERQKKGQIELKISRFPFDCKEQSMKKGAFHQKERKREREEKTI